MTGSSHSEPVTLIYGRDMPFKSNAQARLFYAALKDPKLRQKHNITEETAKQIIDKNAVNELPERIKRRAIKAKASKKTKVATK